MLIQLKKFFLLLFLGIILFTAGYFLIKPKVIDVDFSLAKVSQNLQAQPIENNYIELLFVGDIMLDRGVEYQILKQNNWRWPFMKIADELKKADVLFGNLEGPISDKGTKAGSMYSFRNDPRVITGLNYAGFNILSIANNHAFDYGRTALEDTLSRLKEAKIDYVGGGFNATEAGLPVIKEINGSTGSPQAKIAFLAYTNLCPLSWKATKEKSGINCITENNLEKVKQDIINAKGQVDVVIVSLHAGEEYSQELNQFQIAFSKAAIDAGADFVIGHHPHVVQKYEQYPEKKSEISNGAGKNGWIFYSLGNFIFDQSFSEETMKGLMVKVLFEDKKIKEVTPINIKINSEFQPEIER